MVKFDLEENAFVGSDGRLPVPPEDEVARKLAMLIEGECLATTRLQAAAKFGYSRQRYSQLKVAFMKQGIDGLVSKNRGPKTHYRRTKEVVCQTIRHRFLDPEALADVIAQKLRQSGFTISTRSVERILEEYGLQKKTLQVPTRSTPRNG